MKIGLSSYTWSWAVGVKGYEPEKPIGIMDLFEMTKSRGIPVLQIIHNINLHEMSEEEVAKVSSAADDYGIEIEVGTWGIEPEHLLRYLELAKKMRAKLVRSVTESWDEKAETNIKEVLPQYEEAGVSLALENVDEHPAEELARFVERIGSPLVGICLDTVNSFAAVETPETVVKVLSPYTLCLHVKDYDIVRVPHMLGFNIEGRPAGEGRLDVPWIIANLKKERRDPNVILEIWTPFTNTLEETIKKENEWVDRSLVYLKSIIH